MYALKNISRFIKDYLLGHKVLLVGADTFRAGAVEQLSVWAERLNCQIVKGKQDQDPASVAFDATKKAKEEGM